MKYVLVKTVLLLNIVVNTYTYQRYLLPMYSYIRGNQVSVMYGGSLKRVIVVKVRTVTAARKRSCGKVMNLFI